jgi:hypothetical protein
VLTFITGFVISITIVASVTEVTSAPVVVVVNLATMISMVNCVTIGSVFVIFTSVTEVTSAPVVTFVTRLSLCNVCQGYGRSVSFLVKVYFKFKFSFFHSTKDNYTMHCCHPALTRKCGIDSEQAVTRPHLKAEQGNDGALTVIGCKYVVTFTFRPPIVCSYTAEMTTSKDDHQKPAEWNCG